MAKITFIRQSEAAECGLACVAMVASFFGRFDGLVDLRRRFNISIKGTRLRELMDIAGDLGLSPRPLQIGLEPLMKLKPKSPIILHWDFCHYVVLSKIRGGVAEIYDPASGIRLLTKDAMSEHFTGVALELVPGNEFEAGRNAQRLALSDLWHKSTGIFSGVSTILLLSLVVSAIALAIPFITKLVLDTAIGNGDRELLLALACAMVMLAVGQAATQYVRSVATLAFSNTLMAQVAGNVLRHLLHLPPSFYERRSVGDILNRMGAVRSIRDAVSQTMITTIIDSITALVTLTAMLILSPTLAAAVVFFGLLMLFVTTVSFPRMRAAQERILEASASEQSQIIENIRSMTTIRLFGAESLREAAWRNIFTEFTDASYKFGRLNALLESAKLFISLLQFSVVLVAAGFLAIDNQVTIGTIFAFLSYRQTFSDGLSQIASKTAELRMLNLYLERLSDIVQTEKEYSVSTSSLQSARAPTITLNNLAFRYAGDKEYLFNNLSRHIYPDSFFAISGKTGCGKTTLIRLLLGFFPPTDGEILIDGAPLDQVDIREWRQKLGVVMQDDQLLAGTIADNIAFFDPEWTLSRVQEVSEMAGIHTEIMSMPMKYMSIVGDLNSGLSGGQRQRILLARALYKKPKVLILDEGTANLDAETERNIGAMLKGLKATKIVIAHRSSLIEMADDVIYL